MKILAINGSPKGKKSSTYIMVESFFKGAIEKGAETFHVLLSEKKINNCMGCFTCWNKTPGKCIFDDGAHTWRIRLRKNKNLYTPPKPKFDNTKLHFTNENIIFTNVLPH